MISTKSYEDVLAEASKDETPPLFELLLDALHLRTTFWMFRNPYAVANRSTVFPPTSSVTSRRSGFLARGVLNGRGPETVTPNNAYAARRNV